MPRRASFSTSVASNQDYPNFSREKANRSLMIAYIMDGIEWKRSRKLGETGEGGLAEN